MRKTARLDQILLRLGFCDQDQITRGLRHQKDQGGRLGTNLVQLGAITEQQLLTALSEQFRLPTMVPEQRNVREELVRRMPPDVVASGLALPISWNEEQKVLSMAVANPSDTEALERVKQAFGARGVRAALAADSVLAALALKFAPPDDAEQRARGIRLPELFEVQKKGSEPEPQPAEGVPRRRVLMVTKAASRRNFLPPVFQREGCELTVACTAEEAATALAEGAFEVLLLSQESAEDFSAWVRNGHLPTPAAEVTVFSSVSSGLLDNPLPYDMTVRSLRSAVQALADYRCAQLGASLPYGLIAADVDVLAERHCMRRVARDGLQLGVHMLLPAPLAPGVDPVGTTEPFAAFTSSLELATRIQVVH